MSALGSFPKGVVKLGLALFEKTDKGVKNGNETDFYYALLKRAASNNQTTTLPVGPRREY